jgi:hypothetical protein
MPTAPTVFISYSHKDEVWKDRLVKQLAVLESQGRLETWDDRRIGAGDEWLQEIKKGMDTARVAVFLVSADSLTSKFILDTEIPHLLERRTRDGMTVFPIVCRDCLWEEVAWLSKLEARPRDGKALASYRGNRINLELKKVAQEILEIVRNGAPTLSANPPDHPQSISALVQEPTVTMILPPQGSHTPGVTERQLQIAEQYNKILEAQMQPLFRFVSNTRSIGQESFDAIELWNDGAPIESYQVMQKSFIQVTRPEPGPGYHSTRLIPSYYLIRRDYQGDARTGLLVTFYAWRDPIGQAPGVNLTKEYKRLQAELYKKYNYSVMITKRVFLQIYYIDRIGTSKNVTYEIYPSDTGYGPQVPAKRKLSMAVGYSFELKNLTADNLFDNWEIFEELTDVTIR